MAIYKGQLMNQETKDILYPQTSTDMVDGLEELLEHNPRQLLINPDFQINQRGKTEYNENKDGTYTLDMWRTRQGNYSNAIKMIPKSGGGVTIILPSDGINAGFNQCLPMDESVLGKKFVAVVSKDGKIYDYKLTLGTTDVGKYLESGVKLNVTYDNVNKYIRFALYFDNNSLQSKTFDIDYCDLWEGDIVYPHQKEDKGIALMRCQSKIANVQIPEKTAYASELYYTGENFPVVMDATPVIVEVKLLSNALDVSDKFAYAKMSKYGIFFFKTKQAVGLLRGNILVSCEPL